MHWILQNKPFITGLGVALLLHVTLFMLAVPKQIKSITTPTETKALAIELSKSVFYPNTAKEKSSSLVPQLKTSLPLTDTHKRSVVPQKQLTQPAKNASQNALSTQHKAKITSENYQKLLKELHESIQHRQVYPSFAKRMGYKGITRIRFFLHPDGLVSKPRTITTSGYQQLDQAALDTIIDLSPFKPAQTYITTAQQFTIDIHFK